MSEQKQTRRVSNLSEAISILAQGCELGRQKAIYDWPDLNLIGQALAIVETVQQEQLSKAEKEKAEQGLTETTDNTAPDIAEETAPVILDPKS